MHNAALGLRLFLSRKYDLKTPKLQDTAELEKRNAFNAVGLVSTKLAVNPGDMFTVYETSVPDTVTGGYEDILNYDDIDDPEAYA